jgi:thioredoxin-related protein
MKTKNLFSIISAAVAIIILVAAGEKYEMLSIGSKAPKADVKMEDISGKKLSLTDIKKEKGLLVIFSCNTCPFVLAWEDRYPALGELCTKNNIGMVLINSNEARRSGVDSKEEMQKHASEKNYNCAYVIDEKSELANAFGAKTTPHVYLFDKDMKLVYRGAIDDSEGREENKPREFFLTNAIENLSAGKPITPSETKQVGCSIKRAS